jgi:hypothetical protein
MTTILKRGTPEGGMIADGNRGRITVAEWREWLREWLRKQRQLSPEEQDAMEQVRNGVH